MATLSGRVAIVTGGSRGIGAAAARRLAREGAVVVLTYAQREDAALAVVREIEGRGGEADAARADMADLESIRRLIAETVANYGRLDILVNNAGVAEFLPLEQIDEAHFTRIMEVNVRGPLFAIREAARVMANPGRIINVSSGASQSAPPSGSVYSASKSALETITRSLAAELGSKGITVNVVAPGITQTEMLASTIPEPVLQRLIANTALGRVGEPEDIADAIAFLASDDARWITGQILGANGGLR